MVYELAKDFAFFKGILNSDSWILNSVFRTVGAVFDWPVSLKFRRCIYPTDFWQIDWLYH